MAGPKRTTPDVGFLTRSPSPGRDRDLFATATAAPQPITALVPADLEDNPYQPRLQVDPAGIQELATVIQTQGFQGVLVARPHPTIRGRYQLAWGHRRRDAAQAAGLATIPVMVRALSEEDMLEVALTENIQREDLTPLEEGRSFDLMLTKLEYTYEQVASAVGKGKGYVQNRVRLARAPADVQAFMTHKPDSLRAVASLVAIAEPALRAQVIQQLVEGRLTTDEIPGYLEALRQPGPPGVATIPPRAGSPVREGAGSSPTDDTEPSRSGFRAMEAPAPGSLAGPDPASGDPVGGPGGDLRPQDTGRVGDEGARIGQGILAAVLRNLTRYQAQAQQRPPISLKEATLLAEITHLSDELYQQHGPPPID